MQELVEVRADWFEQAPRPEFRTLFNESHNSHPDISIERRELALIEAAIQILDDGSGEPPPYDEPPSRDLLPPLYLPDEETEATGTYYDDSWGGRTRADAEHQQKIWRRRGAL